MKYWKVFCGAVLFAVLASNVWSITHWNESRGVYDDVCYLRQAHLFQRFGIGGLDTDVSRDDDHYLTERLKAIHYPTWSDPKTAPCHTLMPATGKLVMQYPPGTGFVLALFPQGFQVIPLYVLTSVVAFGFALAAIVYASGLFSSALVVVLGVAAIYLMINPTKASYSMAPTMMICALAGFLTAKLFVSAAQRYRLVLALLIGLLLGLSVNFRLANLFLAFGYFLFFSGSLLLARNRETLLQGLSFGAAFAVGVVPTLLANAINAGSPFSTTYGGGDAASPQLNLGVLRAYLSDLQFALLVIAGVWTALIWRLGRPAGNGQVALVVAGNLVVNAIFFMTHPLFAPYYLMPAAMLSLSTLLFATLMAHREVGDSATAICAAARR